MTLAEEMEALSTFTEAELKNFIGTANAIVVVRERKLWREEFGSFNEWCLSRLGLTEEVAQIYVSAAKRVQALRN